MLKETALVGVHRDLGARLVDFGGWNMPLHYGSQIQEHAAVRSSAGVFDVSHMTIVDVCGADAEAFLRYLLANDVVKLAQVGNALYSVMLNEQGGVVDDLIVYRLSMGFRLVVNCATRDKDLAWIAAHSGPFSVETTEQCDVSMLAVQGPQARSIVHAILANGDDDCSALTRLTVFNGLDLGSVGREGWYVGRTGYTGEDGYEIMLPNTDAAEFFEQLIEAGVVPCGLAARDTLRLEAGMNLYGNEMDEKVSPLVSNLAWTIAWEPLGRHFIGRDALVKQKEQALPNKLVGLVSQGKGVLRPGQEVTIDGVAGLGVITSGTFSPTLGVSIGLARVPVLFEGKALVRIRNRDVAVNIGKPCFVRKGKHVF